MKLVIRWQHMALGALTLLGFLLRLYGLNWDQGNNFHPDERQILFHVVALSWPTSLSQFLDAANSPLNPHFFAYGSFPMYLLALLGQLFLHPKTFVGFTLLGRVLSALFDSGTILLTGLLGLQLGLQLAAHSTPGSGQRYGNGGWNLALFAAALVAFTPFQLQLAHFYAVDSVLLFFVMLTLLACVKLVDTEKPVRWLLVAALGYGLAMATKVSAAPLAVPLAVALILRCYRRRDLLSSVIYFCCTGIFTLLLFVVTQPYVVLDHQNFLEQVFEQSSLARGTLDLPYVRQFTGTLPVVYELQNIVLWGMGVTLGIAALVGLLWMCWRVVWRRDAGLWLVLLAWVLVYGGINCTFFVKYMRYMLPVYPALTLLGAAAVLALVQHRWRWQSNLSVPWQRLLDAAGVLLLVLVLGGTVFQGLALLNVYSQPNTRVQASRWLYQHVPPGSVLTYEQWDDPLPVPVAGHDPSQYVQASYTESTGQQTTGLDLYGDDTTAKAQELARLLPTVNAITMASDRLDKSIPRLPARYPLTIHYYHLLFTGQLGFHLAAQFQNHPHLLGITLDDSGADESYSVFDHPHVRIFERDNPYPYSSAQLFQKLLAGVTLPSSSAAQSS